MTPNEITTLIASELEKQLDEPFKAMVMERVNVWRGTLIRRSLERDIRERRFFKQTVWVKMQKGVAIPCHTVPVQCSVAVVAGDVRFPRPLRANGIMFDYVGSADGMTPFQNAETSNIPYLLKGKYSSKNIYYNIQNDSPIVYGNNDLPLLRIDGIFDDPLEAMAYTCACTCNGCDYWNEEYPCSGDIIQAIIQYIMQVDFNRAPAEGPTKPIPVTENTRP